MLQTGWHSEERTYQASWFLRSNQQWQFEFMLNIEYQQQLINLNSSNY